MGKTIQTISLILSDWSPSHPKGSTLVLAPTVAIVQWKNEIEKFTKGFKVLIFHGTNRLSNVKEMEKYDVVLTSCASWPLPSLCFRGRIIRADLGPRSRCSPQTPSSSRRSAVSTRASPRRARS